MPRKPRREVAGGVHHVFARGNRKEDIYLEDADRRIYLALLAGVVVRQRWRLLAYCLMQNHVHLLIETAGPNLGWGMQRLHGEYAQTFNRRHARTGHLFQDRYGSVAVTSDAQLWMTAAYIALNPVEAGLCEDPADWPWASHRALLEGDGPRWLDSARLLWYFAGSGGDPRRRYAEHVGDGLRRIGARRPEPARAQAV
jgi:putative transposase